MSKKDRFVENAYVYTISGYFLLFFLSYTLSIHKPFYLSSSIVLITQTSRMHMLKKRRICHISSMNSFIIYTNWFTSNEQIFLFVKNTCMCLWIDLCLSFFFLFSFFVVVAYTIRMIDW